MNKLVLLLGMERAETAKKYGEEQVRIWRRSKAVRAATVRSKG